MIDVDPTALGLEFGGGAVLGGLVGFAVKRIAKLLAIVAGIQFMLVRYLESREIVVVNWDRLATGLVTTQDRTREAEVHWMESLLPTLSLGAGFTSGFLIGFYRG